MNRPAPDPWALPPPEVVSARLGVVARAMGELRDAAACSPGFPGDLPSAPPPDERHARLLARLHAAVRRTDGPRPVLLDILRGDEAAWRRYGYIQGAIDLLRELRAPPEPLLARLEGLDRRDPEDVRSVVLDGARVALAFAGREGADAALFRDAARRLGLGDGVAEGTAEGTADGAKAPPLRTLAHPVLAVARRALLHPDGRAEAVVRGRLGERIDVRVTDGSDASVGGAALLRTHLDLLDLALRRDAGASPVVYDLSAALARLGYRRQSHGAFDARTRREHHRRLARLADLALDARFAPTVGGGGPVRELRAPLWEIEACRAPGRAGDALPRRFLVRPGAWWDEVRGGGGVLEVPRALLALPTDGKGNEVGRVALRLGVDLLLHPAEAARTADRPPKRTVGALLERASVATYAELHDDALRRGNRAKRLRAYLAGSDEGGGAFGVLARLGVADVRVADERGFWASGPGWLDRFWDAPLRVSSVRRP